MAYFGPGAPPSPKTVARWRVDLARFRVAYVQYVDRTLPILVNGGAVVYDGQRQDLVRLAALADRAATRAGVTPFMLPPPAFGGVVTRGLSSVAFAHEDPRNRPPDIPFGSRPKTSPELTMEALDMAEGNLALMEAEARKRYRSPVFWADRVLRMVLGFPAYLLSVILGFDPTELSTNFQRLLWLLSVAADLAALYGVAKGVHLL